MPTTLLARLLVGAVGALIGSVATYTVAAIELEGRVSALEAGVSRTELRLDQLLHIATNKRPQQSAGAGLALPN